MAFYDYIQGLNKRAWHDYLSGREEKRAEINKNILDEDLQLLANDVVKMLRGRVLESDSKNRMDSLLSDALEIYLTSSVEGSSLNSNIDKMIQAKQSVKDAMSNYGDAACIDLIAEKTGLPEDFVGVTIEQYKDAEASGKEDPVSFLQATDGRRIKTYFHHRWANLLNLLHSEGDDGLPIYKRYSADARRKLADLLPVHKSILEGTGWGAGLSRQTKKSYVEMFYEFLDQPYKMIEG